MTLFLQYNVNNHILDDVRHLLVAKCFISESVATEQGSTEFRTSLCVILAMPLLFSILVAEQEKPYDALLCYSRLVYLVIQS